MVGFSGSAPATRAAVQACGPVTAVLGRVLVGSLLAAALLLLARERLPAARHRWRLLIVSLTVVIGFPTLTALALRKAPASHMALCAGLIPLLMSILARQRSGERPPAQFWLAALTGCSAIATFALTRGAALLVGRADALLLAASFAAAVGYHEGAILTRSMGGWRVTCWALLAAAPVAVAVALRGGPSLALASASALLACPQAAVGIGYLGVVSALLAFFAWYRGLAAGGIAKAGHLQLAQLPLSLLWSVLLLGERVGFAEVITATTVMMSLLLVLQTPVARSATLPKGQS